ncbi:hypothetical protein niasHT_005282 [Heterodera trifolii]|uniref:Cns1/TTC4 wheel domain-containing protein n=1 Tax=Heterodera trifolii TaxID=157864 RepID=A0ABD2M0L4_9BILA
MPKLPYHLLPFLCIKLRCSDVRLNSVLFANRSAAHRRLGNVRSAFKDCFFARRFDSENLKAIRRGAECLLELGEAAKCIAWIETKANEGGTISPKAQMDEQLEKMRNKAEAMRAEEDRDARRERATEILKRRRNTKLIEALRTRGVRLCPPVDEPDELCQHLQISFGPLERHLMVRLVEEGTKSARLIWPLLLQYPEKGQTDFLSECAEDIPLAEAFEEVFSSPAHWDSQHQFRPDNVRFFVALSGADERERIREIFPEKHSLRVVLQWPDVCVAMGLPVIQVYTRQHLEQNELKASGGEKDIFRFGKG